MTPADKVKSRIAGWRQLRKFYNKGKKKIFTSFFLFKRGRSIIDRWSLFSGFSVLRLSTVNSHYFNFYFLAIQLVEFFS